MEHNRNGRRWLLVLVVKPVDRDCEMTEIMFANEVSDYFVFRLDDGVFISTEVPENVWPPFLG
jgi:hypothetical protein